MNKLLLLVLLCGCESRSVYVRGAGDLEVTVHTKAANGAAEVEVTIGARPVYQFFPLPIFIPYAHCQLAEKP